jgi:hypothetical protein
MSSWDYVFGPTLLQKIEELSVRAARADRHVRREQRLRVEELEHELGRLNLVCRALIGMLKEQGHFDAAIFNTALDKIDAEDGVIDGRVTPEDERPVKPGSLPRSAAPTARRKG